MVSLSCSLFKNTIWRMCKTETLSTCWGGPTVWSWCGGWRRRGGRQRCDALPNLAAGPQGSWGLPARRPLHCVLQHCHRRHVTTATQLSALSLAQGPLHSPCTGPVAGLQQMLFVIIFVKLQPTILLLLRGGPTESLQILLRQTILFLNTLYVCSLLTTIKTVFGVTKFLTPPTHSFIGTF